MSDKHKNIMVIGEVRHGHLLTVTLELTGKARELADKCREKVITVLFFDKIDFEPEEIIKFGADEVICVKNDKFKEFNQEIYTNAIVEIIGKYSPSIVLTGATSSGRTFLPAIAGKINTGLTADCTGLDIDSETGLLLQTRPAIGGNIMATIKTPTHRPQMATVRPKNFAKPEPVERTGRVEYLVLSEKVYESRIEVEKFEELEGENVNIQDLDVIVSGGKGLKRADSYEMLKELASLLEGGVGASRPPVESKWISFPHQVGLSGKVVSPKVYFAIGLSGTVQHMAGMQTSEFIIAVNKDKEAPIFQISDIGLCGDLFEIVPKIIEAVRKEKGMM